jgi:penicillin-binding protein 1C
VALQQSYNLPAVTLLDWLGASRVAASLRGAGAHLAIPGNGPATLPLALGGVGMDLWDLTQLYTGLATGGMVAALRTLGNEPASAGTALLTQGGARAVIDMLADAPPPAGLSVLSPRRIAYKTGTSFGFRDAWAFGSLPGLTAGIWVGRPDGTPRPGAFARGTAAPLLFRVFDLLPDQPGWPATAASDADGPRAPGLRHLHLREDRDFMPNAPRIVFPPAGAGLEIHAGQALALEAAGGTPPYRWIINGVPLPAPQLGSPPSWQPDGAGFAHLTVTDSADLSVEEDIRVR